MYGVGFSYGIGQNIPKGGNGVPKCSLTIPRGLHMFRPGNTNERPSFGTEDTKRFVRLDKVREIGWPILFDGAER